MEQPTHLITIKGTRFGLTVTLGQGDFSAILHELTERLRRTASFFKGAQVHLQSEGRALAQHELAALLAAFREHEIILRHIVTTDAATRAAAQALGLEVLSPVEAAPAPPAEEEAEPEEPPGRGDAALLVRRTLRSGQLLRHAGHVVVIGDVNPGAEIVAGGNVVVWGKLRGLVHAGAMGDDEAVVCALSLAPTQLRIGNHIARAPEEKKDKQLAAEIAQVRNGQIVVAAWG